MLLFPFWGVLRQAFLESSEKRVRMEVDAEFAAGMVEDTATAMKLVVSYRAHY